MAEFNKLIVTSKGQELIAKLIANQSNIEFTKISTSENIYTEEQIVGLISITNVKQTANISKTTRINDVAVQIEAALDNSTLNTGYNLNSVGVYAKDNNNNEILYAVASVENSSKGSYMPAFNNLTVTGAYLKLTITVSNSEKVTLNINQAGVATIANINELQNQISDLQAFIGYTDDDIYGVEIDFVNNKFTRLAGSVGKTAGNDFDSINCFGGRKRCNLTDEGKVVAYYGDAAFTTTGALTQAVTIEEGKNAGTYSIGTKVQVMVEQPKFYYKVVPIELEKYELGYHIRKANYYISDKLKAGFKVHPAFIRNNIEKECIYLSAFEASLFDVSTNSYISDNAQVADYNVDMLSSIANVKPITGTTQSLVRENGRKLAQKRGKGWELSYIATIALTQMLMLIEYASFNVQEVIGEGIVSKTAEAIPENTGMTTALGDMSGKVNSIDAVSYRGEENLWGNVFTWIDGINIQANKIYVADNNFKDYQLITSYQDTNICIESISGYISAFGYNKEFDWLFIPTELKGNDLLPIGDSCMDFMEEWGGVSFGGAYFCNTMAGAFCYWINDNSGGQYIGCRLVYIPNAS